MFGADDIIEKLTEKKPMSVGDFAHAHLDQLNPQKSNAAKMGSLILRIEITVPRSSHRRYFKDMPPVVRFHAEAAALLGLPEPESKQSTRKIEKSKAIMPEEGAPA